MLYALLPSPSPYVDVINSHVMNAHTSFRSQPHKLELYERNGHYSFYGALKDLAYLDDHFFRCHKSFIIHLKNVKEFNFKSRYVLMENGSRCPIAFRLIVPLQKRLKSLKEDFA